MCCDVCVRRHTFVSHSLRTDSRFRRWRLTNHAFVFRMDENLQGRAAPPERHYGLFSCRRGSVRHCDGKRPLVLEGALPMANDRIFRTLSRGQEPTDLVAEVMVTACEPTVVPGFQQRVSERAILTSIH